MEYWHGEFTDAIEKRKDKLRSSEVVNVVNDVFEKYKQKNIVTGQAVEALNNTILDIIFVGENSPTDCKACKKKSCKKKDCPVKKGLKSKKDVLRDVYSSRLWPDILNKASSSEEILKFAEKNMQKGLEEYLQSSPFSKHQ